MSIYAIGTNYWRLLNSDDPLRPGELSLTTDNIESAVIDHAAGIARDRTPQEILTWTKAAKLTSIRAEAKTRIESSYPQWRQLDAALGLLPDAYTTQMRAEIAAIIEASNTAEDVVDAATTIESVNAVEAVWP